MNVAVHGTELYILLTIAAIIVAVLPFLIYTAVHESLRPHGK